MAYDKHTYTKGDILEASDLNHGEGGIDANDEGIAALQSTVSSQGAAITTLGNTLSSQGTTITGLQGNVSALETAVGKLPSPAENDGTFVITQHNGNMSLTEIPNNAGSHNAIYRGKYLGNTVTAEQYAAISDGSFKDLYIGDYWTINGVNWRIAHCDYWLRYGDTECTTHHLVIVPDTNLLAGNGSTTHWFNATDTTTGAYVGSDWYTGNNDNTGRAQVTTMINNAFGSAHILTHREYLKNATANGYESAGAWYDSTHEFMTEEMVYGTKEFKNIVNGTNIPAGYTIDHGQLALFRHDHSKICNRATWWLRDVVSSAFFAYVNSSGLCARDGASNTWVGVRVAFGIKA